MFLLIVLAILGLIYGYTGWRLIPALRLSFPWNLAATCGVLLLMALPVLTIRLRGSDLPGRLHDLIVWVAYLGMGFFVLTFSLLVVRDLAWTLLVGVGKALTWSGLWESTSTGPAAPHRRQFLLNALNLGTVGLSSLLTAFGLYAARYRIRVFAEQVPIDGLPPALEGFRIVQISDIHVGLTIGRDFVERIVEQVAGLHPHLIAFTGDIVDGEVEKLRSQVAPLAALSAPCGCFFSTGNHEYYNSDPEGWIAEVRNLGFTPLLNEHRQIEWQGARFVLAGVTDYGAGDILPHHASDPVAALTGAPTGLVRILMAHQPRSIYEVARQGCDLMLSGHTHGGQFIPWKYFVPLQQPFLAGLDRHEKTWIYVNRGTGYWGPPLRVGVPAEITLLTLTRAQERG